jgi:hypothetical protein
MQEKCPCIEHTRHSGCQREVKTEFSDYFSQKFILHYLTLHKCNCVRS